MTVLHSYKLQKSFKAYVGFKIPMILMLNEINAVCICIFMHKT